MKPFLLLLLAGMLIIAPLGAAVQNFPVTPATLSSWQQNGTKPDQYSGLATLTLPAGAELVRSFGGGAVVVGSVSRPIFGTAAANWPVLQVGPVAVALIREGDHGQLALVVGESVRILPLEIPLDAEGRSQQPLELVLGYDPSAGVAVVSFADQVMAFPISGRAPPVEVSIAAGGQSAWELTALEVAVLTVDRPEPSTSPVAESSGKVAGLLKSTGEKLRQEAVAATGTVPGSGAAGASPGPAQPAAAAPTLEIFTPPSVRMDPAAVRAAVVRSQQK